MASSPLAWLLAELPRLQEQQIIDADTAARLRAHYLAQGRDERRVAIPLTALLGVLLVGAGVILLVAQDWQHWSAPLRLGAAAVPLLAALAACAYALRHRPQSRWWREASASCAGLALAAFVALAEHILQRQDAAHLQLLTVWLASLPLLYLMRASLLAALLAGLMLWLLAELPESLRQPWQALLLYASLAPQLIWLHRIKAAAELSLLFSLCALLLAAALSLSMRPLQAYGWLWCAQLGTLWLLADALSASLSALPWRPLRAGGELFWAVPVLAAGYAGFWTAQPGAALAQANIVLQLALPLIALLGLLALRRGRWLQAALALAPLLLALLQGRPGWLPVGALVLLANAYALAIGVGAIMQGLRTRQLREISAGLTLLAALVLLRFFGSDWPLLLRGLAFIGVGLGFLAAHAWLRRHLA